MFWLISEIFVDLNIKGGFRKLPQSFFLVEVSQSNNSCAAFVGRFNDYIFAFFFRLFSADHSSEERLENLVLRLNLSLLIA